MCSRDEAAIRAAAEDVQRRTGADVQWTVADVGTAEGCQKLVKTAVDKFGDRRHPVSNAGGPPPGRFDDLDDAAWQKAVGITLFSAVRLTRLVLPHMRKAGGGSIVYMTSTTVRQPTQYLNLILSNSIRAAVQGWRRRYRASREGRRPRELRPAGPHSFTPSASSSSIDTAEAAEHHPGRDPRATTRRRSSDGPLRKPEEFAAAVVFLASAEGVVHHRNIAQVDGGMLNEHVLAG